MSLIEGMIYDTVDPLLAGVEESLSSDIRDLAHTTLDAVPSALLGQSEVLAATVGAGAELIITNQGVLIGEVNENVAGTREDVNAGVTRIMTALNGLPGEWKQAFDPTTQELGSMAASMGKMGEPGALEEDPALGNAFFGPFQRFIAGVGLTEERAKEAASSPVDRAKAAKIATGISVAAQTGLGVLYSIGVAAEIASLGQLETIVNTIDGLLENTGISEILKPLFGAPFWPSVITPTRQYWNSVFTPEIPGPSDLVRFLVREVIDTGTFAENMAYQGYSQEKSDWFWDAHWILPSRGELVDALHRNVITEAEYDQFIVWHDYSPKERPGISKSDLEILGGVRRTLIPRVDLRRAWLLDVVSDAELEDRYRFLGYEEDAPLMAEIQKAVALNAYRSTYGRALLRSYRKGDMTQEAVTGALKELRYRDEAIALLIATEDLQATAGSGEPDEELRTLSAAQLLRAYRYRVLPRDEVTGKLQVMRFNPEDIDILLSINEPYLEAEPRTLTSSQILRAYQTEIRDEAWATEQLEGYDFRSEDIQVLLALYPPPEVAPPTVKTLPVSDVRSAWEMQLPGFERMGPRFEQLDYTPEDAATKAAIERRRAVASDIGALENEVEARYRGGFLLESQARADLEALGFHPLVIDAKLELYTMRREREHWTAQLDSAEEAFLRDLVDFSVVEDTAKRLIVNEDVREEYLDRVYFRKLRVVRE